MPSAAQPAAPTTKPFSLTLSKSKPKSTTTTPKPTLPKKRPHSTLADNSDSDTPANAPSPILLATFDASAGGAIPLAASSPPKSALIIPAPPNRNWRDESRRKRAGKNLLPAEEQAARNGHKGEHSNFADDAPPKYGLTVQARAGLGDAGGVNGRTAQALEAAQTGAQQKAEDPLPPTADEEALAALLGDGAKKSTLVIEAISGTGDDIFSGRGAVAEDGFKADVASRPDSASLAEYEAVPVEEFGAALMRGMGWREGDAVGKRKGVVVKARVPQRRPDELGIGAKEAPEGPEVLGAWGRGEKRAGKGAVKYSPVLLRDRVTGEVLSEEELKARRERGAEKGDRAREGQKDEGDWRERRDRNLAIDESRKAGRRETERDRNRDKDRDRDRDGDRAAHASNRQHSSRRERSPSPERSTKRHGHSDRNGSEHRPRDRDERERRDERDGHKKREREGRDEHNGRERERGQEKDRRYRDKDDDRERAGERSKYGGRDGDRDRDRDRDREREGEREREKERARTKEKQRGDHDDSRGARASRAKDRDREGYEDGRSRKRLEAH